MFKQVCCFTETRANTEESDHPSCSNIASHSNLGLDFPKIQVALSSVNAKELKFFKPSVFALKCARMGNTESFLFRSVSSLGNQTPSFLPFLTFSPPSQCPSASEFSTVSMFLELGVTLALGQYSVNKWSTVQLCCSSSNDSSTMDKAKKLQVFLPFLLTLLYFWRLGKLRSSSKQPGEGSK